MKDEKHTPPPREEGVTATATATATPQKTMSMEALIEKNLELERKVEGLQADKRQLKQIIRKSRRMFPREFREWERMEDELGKLREEQETPTLKKVQGLKKSLCKLNVENIRKEAVIKRLKARLTKRTGSMIGGPKVEVDLTGAEGMDAADIFPEEVWELILHNVEDPQDRWNCYNTCALFRRLLHQWKTTWVFEQALPHLFPHLSRVQLLKCRLVSKGWKWEVDEFLQNHPTLRPHNVETCNPRLLPFVDPQKEKELAIVNKFVFISRTVALALPRRKVPQTFDSTHRTILSSRSLNLQVDIFEEAQDRKNFRLWEQIYALLRNVGRDIWYLILHLWSDAVPSPWVKRKILTFLGGELFGFVPNLRNLTIEHLPDFSAGDVHDIEINPELLPPLFKLETVELEVFGGDGWYHAVLLGVLERYHAQLGRLSLNDAERAWGECYILEWPELTELHLNVSSLDPLDELPRMDMPNLAKLGLVFSFLPHSTFPEDETISRLLLILTRLSATTRLSTLRLDESVIKMLKVLGEVPMFVCMPPTLKTLELDYNSEGIIPNRDYRFLLYFPHLENLNVFYRDHQLGGVSLRSEDQLEADLDRWRASSFEGRMTKLDLDQEVVEVNKFMYLGQMYRSNIWELLPRLKVFTFQWKVYTRGGYEEYSKKKRTGEEN